MPPRAAVLPHAQTPEGKIQIVVRDEDGGARRFMPGGYGGDGLAARVHEGLRFDEKDVARGRGADEGILFCLPLLGAQATRRLIEHHESDIVSRTLVADSG